jgi:hypothetical protein
VSDGFPVPKPDELTFTAAGGVSGELPG